MSRLPVMATTTNLTCCTSHFMNPLEADQIRRLGEVTYMHQKMDASDAWIEQHPRRFAMLTGESNLPVLVSDHLQARPDRCCSRTLSIAGIVGLALLGTAALCILDTGFYLAGLPARLLSGPTRQPISLSNLLVGIASRRLRLHVFN